jgi:hypothetical protein
LIDCPETVYKNTASCEPFAVQFGDALAYRRNELFAVGDGCVMTVMHFSAIERCVN